MSRAKEHYDGVLRDMLSMYDRNLAENEYMIWDYSVAGIACYPDVHIHGVNDIGPGAYPNLKRWYDAIEARPAAQRARIPFG